MRILKTLRMRIFLLFGFLFLTFLLADQAIERFGLPFSSFEGRIREKESEALKALNLTADLKKERLLLWIEERKADSIVLTENPVIRKYVADLEKMYRGSMAEGITGERLWDRIRNRTDYREIRRYLDVFLASYGAYDGIDLIDLHSGGILISTSEEEEGTAIYGDSVSFTNLSSPKDYSVNAWRHPLSGEFHLHINRLLSLEDENDQGLVLVMHLNTSHFIEPLLQTGGGLGDTGEALLVNGEGWTLTSLKFPLPDGSRARPIEYRITAGPAELAAVGGEGTIATEDYRGVQVLAAYRHIDIGPEIGWGLVVKRDRAEIYRGYRQENLVSLLMMILGILFVVGFTYLLAGSLSGPLIDVSNTAKRIREGDLSARVEVKGTEEIEVLAETFNTMVERIKIFTEQLKEKNEELEAFLYTAAHDLKNPLIGAQGFFSLLDKSLNGKLDSNQRYLMERITVTLKQFEVLLTDLLEYSQVRTGPLVAGRVLVEDLINRIKAEQWEVLKKSGGEIHVQENLPELQINESRAYQVFSNLISNSLKYTRDGVKPVIEVGIAPRTQELIPEKHDLFFVTDNGVGIDEMWHDKIFGLFVRIDRTDSEGSGTGLAIVRRIVRQENGRIWVKSTPGSGTTVYFTLPTSL